jgi:hypothetical protein
MEDKTEFEMESKREDGGMLIRGVNGELYFIPDEKLNAFIVPEKKALEGVWLFGLQGSSQVFGTIQGSLVKDRLGLRASDTTTVNVINLGALRQMRKDR